MKRQKPTAVKDLLGNGQGLLQQLRQGSRQADRALQAVREALPQGLASHVWGASVRTRTLTLLVASAAWATRIRYHAPGLREDVGRALAQPIDRVRVRVRPSGPV